MGEAVADVDSLSILWVPPLGRSWSELHVGDILPLGFLSWGDPRHLRDGDFCRANLAAIGSLNILFGALFAPLMLAATLLGHLTPKISCNNASASS